jgi:ribosomal protein S18 acetylase RimI-like enzyme
MRPVLEFQYEVYEGNFAGFAVERDFLVDFERQLRQASRNAYESCWVLEGGRRVVGFVWAAITTSMVDECLGYIKNIYVAPEWRGQGWGERLLEQAERWMIAKGAPKAALDVTAANQAALLLYERSGYMVTRYRMEKPLQLSQEDVHGHSTYRE